MRLGGRSRIAICVVAVLSLATAWGLMVSVVVSEPAISRTELPNDETARERGRREAVVRANYGTGPGELGISFDGETRGPRSFGIDDRERVYVLDGVNSRIVRFSAGDYDTAFPLPDGEFDDIVVARGLVCALARVEDRRVVVLDTERNEARVLPIADSVPAILRLFVVGTDVAVECPSETGRAYHTVGTLDGITRSAVEQAVPRSGGTPVPGGGTLAASLRSHNDIALDVTGRDGMAKTRLRAHSERDVAAILDATTDRFGNVFITWALVADAASPAAHRQGRLVVTRHDVDGELTGRVETVHGSDPEPFRKTLVSESGHLYQLVTDRTGVRVVRWTMTSGEE